MKSGLLKYGFLFLGFVLLLDGVVIACDASLKAEQHERTQESEKEDRAETYELELDEFVNGHFGELATSLQAIDLSSSHFRELTDVHLDPFYPPPKC